MSLDDQLYDIVAKEIRSGTLVDGLYTRAFAEANGDKDKAQAKYIVYRVEQLRGEFVARVERKKAEAREAEEAAKAAESAARRKQQAQDGKDSFFTIVAIILAIIGLALLIALASQKSGVSSM